MESRIITIVGGTGFLGRYVVRRLAKAGWRLRIISRNPDAALHLKTCGEVGQIALLGGNLSQPESFARKLDQSYAVINLAGLLAEGGGGQNFTAVHVRGPERLAQMAKAARAERFVHISALGADKATNSDYARSKLSGEKAVLAAFPEAIVLRPSVVFGPEDDFINRFAQMAAIAPALPLIGGGHTQFQPVYVDDVAKAVEAALSPPDSKTHTYELGGPQTLTFKEILEYILRETGLRRALTPVPFGVASAIGAVAGLLPRAPLTRDQVRLLRYDNTVSPNAKTFAHLGIKPLPMEAVVPFYLNRYRRRPGSNLSAA